MLNEHNDKGVEKYVTVMELSGFWDRVLLLMGQKTEKKKRGDGRVARKRRKGDTEEEREAVLRGGRDLLPSLS